MGIFRFFSKKRDNLLFSGVLIVIISSISHQEKYAFCALKMPVILSALLKNCVMFATSAL